MSFFGNPNIGIYSFANDHLLLIPPGLGSDDIEEMISVLKTEFVETRIAGTILNGVFITGNNRAIILPRIALENEIEVLRNRINQLKLDIFVYVSNSKYTALGNLLLCNNKGCLASLLLEDSEIRNLADVLGVEVIKHRLVNIDVPGSVAVVNDYGGVIHPGASEHDIKIVKEILKVSVERATINAGISFVKSGLVVNNKGILVGGNTTGPETLRIKRGFEGDVHG